MAGNDTGESKALNGTMNRRGFLKLASAFGLTLGGGALLAGCQSAPATPSSPAGATAAPAAPATTAIKPIATTAAAAAAAAPRKGGIFKVPVNADVTPWPPIGQLSNLMVNKSIFNGLVRYSPEDWTPQPDLAEKWEVSKDGLTWTFYLRKGVTWHDGKPFTAEDVKFSIAAYADPKVNSTLLGNFKPVSKIDVVDANTVKVTTSQPYGSFLELLGYLAFMMPKHLLEGQEFTPSKFPQEFIKNPIGRGRSSSLRTCLAAT